MVALESASIASILKASCAWLALSATSERSKGFMNVSVSGEKRMQVPPAGSTTGAYSPAGSKTITSSSGYASIVFMISRLTLKLFPEPGLPQTNPMGLASFLRLQMTRLPDCLDWP